MKIGCFGRLGDLIGRAVEVDPLDASTVAELRGLLAKRYPQAAADLTSPATRACIGDRIVGEEASIVRAGEVEFFPPLSGG